MNNNDYEQFTHNLIKALEQKMQPDNIRLHRDPTAKVNQTLDAISVRIGDSPMAPLVYLQDKYDMYKSGMSVDAIAGMVATTVRESYSTMPPVPELSREAAMKNLFCAVVNIKQNEEMLKDVPHEELEDLSVIARYKVSNDGSLIVKNALCEKLRMTPEEVMEHAHINTEHMDYWCKTISTVIRESLTGSDIPDDLYGTLPEPGSEMDRRMYVMSNSRSDEGAAAITSPKAMHQAYLQLGEDFYILPSSRHEVILVPENSGISAKELQAMVKEVNRTTIHEADWLSDNVYCYKGDSRTVHLADSPLLSKDKGRNPEQNKICNRKR
ncbi:MAG: DUF5688 family protein [Clostridiales bacterium]|nr:DUF5688 family protein [Clostridiales bacterium]